MKQNGIFRNLHPHPEHPHPEHPHPEHSLADILRWQFGWERAEAPLVNPDRLPPYRPEMAAPEKLDGPDPAQVQVTWVGHSTFLIQHGGRNLLTDPIWGNCGPLPLRRLRRMAPPGMAFESLPEIHEVLISHNHYDHLDTQTIRRLGPGPRYWVPEGVGRWFARHKGYPCRELAWWDTIRLADGLEVHCVPAQHFSARSPFDRNRTLWCGWVVRSDKKTIYFAGDTGYCPVFQEIGERFDGFDLSLIPIGAYRPRRIMQAIHANPNEAVQIHRDVRSRLSVACHWGTFRLTDEPPNEPPVALEEVLRREKLAAGVFRVLRFGETIRV